MDDAALEKRVDMLVDRWIEEFEWRATEHSPDSGKAYPMLRQMIREMVGADSAPRVA